jgi:plasmid stabilization system protein ParE
VVDGRSKRLGKHRRLPLSAPSLFCHFHLEATLRSGKVTEDIPYSGRIGTKPGTRELVLVPLPYLMIYAVDEKSIHILRFLHTAQDRL